jgi:hypothetical protein
MKIILDLCGGTGSWSRNYSDAGYDVRVITLPQYDVCKYSTKENIYGILAAPPCDHFSVSGAQYWGQKDIDGRTIGGMKVLIACLRIIAQCQPVFWALENPVGRMRHLLGDPVMIFDPCDFGDPYTKKTLLWGRFNIPAKNRVDPVRVCSQGSWLQKLGGKSEKTKMLRSITPAGFSRAFFEANQ